MPIEDPNVVAPIGDSTVPALIPVLPPSAAPMALTPRDTKSGDDVVLWVVISFCLVTPVVLATCWAVAGLFFPPMLLAVLLGTAIAALTYRYLGGTAGSEFSVGLLKVAGSAALLLGTTWLTDSGLSKQMDAENSANRLREVRIERDALVLERDTAKSQLAEFKGNLPRAVESLSPNASDAKALIELARQSKGPWAPFESKKDVNVTIGKYVKKLNEFAACADTNLSQRSVRFVRKIKAPDGEETRSVSASFVGFIESAICDDQTRKFSIHISCVAGLELFPDEIASCAKDDKTKWKGVTRNFTVRVEVLPR